MADSKISNLPGASTLAGTEVVPVVQTGTTKKATVAAIIAAALSRANHTGTQLASTISNFTEASQDAVGGALVDTATLDLNYSDGANSINGNVLDSPKINGIAVTGTPSSGQVPTATSSSAATWQTPASSGAPTTSDYLVGTSDAGLSNEIVVGTTPGGELGGTWASPTIDATHSGSAHSSFIAKTTADANSVLYAVTDDTPAALAMAASTVVARLASGNVVAATPSQIKTLLAVVSTDLSDFTEASQDAVGASLTDTATVDFTYNDGANTITAAVLDSPKINGIAVTGTPSVGQVPTATSTSAATWQTTPTSITIPSGLAGNGSTDDWSAIQTSLDAVKAAGGGVVFLPKGTYLIKQTLWIGSKVTLAGAGMGATKITKPASVASLLTTNASAAATSAVVTSATGFAIGGGIHFWDTSNFEGWTSTNATITNVSGTTITFARHGGGGLRGNMQTSRSATATTSFPLIRNDLASVNVGVRNMTLDHNQNVNDPGSAAMVINKAVTSNVVTLTTAAPHGYPSGQSVVISALSDATLNGTFTITAVGSTTTFSYALTHSNVSSTATTGMVNVGPAVADFTAATINLEESYHGLFENLEILNAAGDGFSDQAQDGSIAPVLDGTNNAKTKNTIRGCRITGSTRHGVHLGTGMEGAYVLGNEMTACAGYAEFYCAFVTCTISANNIVSACGFGFAGIDDRDYGNVVIGNTILDSINFAIDANNDSGVGPSQRKGRISIVGNTIRGKGIIVGLPECTIQGNTIDLDDTGVIGVELTSTAKRVLIQGNAVHNGSTGSYGLYLHNSADDCRVIGNNFSDLAQGATIGYPSGLNRLIAIGNHFSNMSTNGGWNFEGVANTDCIISDEMNSLISTITGTSASVRLVYEGIGSNGTTNPATGGDWNGISGARYNGRLVRWAVGSVEKVSVFYDGVGWTLLNPTGIVALTDGANIATDASLGSVFKVTLGGSRTIDNPTNPTAGQKITYRLKQDGTGTRLITWDTAFRWSTDVTVPTLTTTASKTDYIGFVYNADDSKWDGIAVSRGY